MKKFRNKRVLETDLNHLPTKHFRYGLAIILILLLAIVIRFTSLIRIFWINLGSAFVVKNWFWALFIGGILVAAGSIERIQFEKKLKKEKEVNHE